MYKKLKVTLVGITPTIQHNGQLANPLNKWSKAMKEISGKRKKTDADFEELAKIEFFGALYLDSDGRPCWPGETIEAMLISAAKKSREGPQAKTGIICDGNFAIKYSGPTDPEKLWADERFRLTVPVRVQSSRIMRTRPIFREWSLPIEISYLEDVVNERTVRDWCNTAGQLIGLSDWRPKYGRFSVE